MLTKERLANWTQWLLFLNTFAVEAIFRQREFSDKSIDLQIIIKMGVWAATFAFCLYFLRRWVWIIPRVDKFFELSLLIVILCSCFYAPNLAYSLASAFSIISIFLLLFMASATLTNKQILKPIIYGCSLVSFLSIAVYFINPEFGRMPQWVGGKQVPGTRITGIVGTANIVGYISAFTLVALYYYRKFLEKKTRILHLFLVAGSFVALIMSDSKTSMVALVLSIALASLVRPTMGKMFFCSVLVCLAIIFSVTVDYDALFSALARSGDAQEIWTGTGRAAIWSVVLDMIAERPFFGWGYGSSVMILGERTSLVGFTVTHTHNAFLQVALTTGLVGLFFFVGIFLTKIFYAIKFRDQANVAFIIFLLIGGITEPIGFFGPATTTTFVLATILSLKFNERNKTR
jgi:exopolysaccharide production protein ExoQ